MGSLLRFNSTERCSRPSAKVLKTQGGNGFTLRMPTEFKATFSGDSR